MGWLEPRRDEDDDERQVHTSQEADAIKRRKAQLDRSSRERKLLVQAAREEFDKVYLERRVVVHQTRNGGTVVQDFGLVESPRLPRTHDPARERTHVIRIPVPDPVREAQLQQRIRELESQLAATQTRHVEPPPTPFNPVRVKTTRKLAVD